MTMLDRRLNAYRVDLAEARLKGQVEAASFVDGELAETISPVASLSPAPRDDAGLDHQLLLGDIVRVFDRFEGWAWVRSERDGYVGYTPESAIGDVRDAATHLVIAPRSFIYPIDDLKSSPAFPVSMGSAVQIIGQTERRGTAYATLATGGSMITRHLRPLGEAANDFVVVAETLDRTPYLWGGTSGFGIDCSGLVYLSMRMAGKNVLRDTDMQEHSIGEAMDAGANLTALKRGDLVFWKGHVAIMTDAENTIHANGQSMMVTRETLADAIARITPLSGPPTSFRRP